MKKDIHHPLVKDVAVAIVKEEENGKEPEWFVYLLNLKETAIDGVLVASRGYGNLQGEDVKTSTLRHFIETLPAKSYAKIELIKDDVFGLHNEYWVSFYINKEIYDKKFVFLAESIKEANFTEIPLMGLRGILIG